MPKVLVIDESVSVRKVMERARAARCRTSSFTIPDINSTGVAPRRG